MAEGGTPEAARGPSGIGGWLIVLAIGQFVAAARVLVAVAKDIGSYQTSPGSSPPRSGGCT